MRPSTLAAVLFAGLALGACTLAPAYLRPAPPVPQAWPIQGPDSPGAASAGDLNWREVIQDQRLQRLIDLALKENRDLRVAVGNIQKARAQYGVQRANLLPTVNVTGSESRTLTPASVSGYGYPLKIDAYSANVGFTGYELDLFGRVRSLNKAALQSYLATEQDRRTTQISLIAEVAGDYLTLAADQDLLKIARDTLKTREDALALTRKEFELGAISRLDLAQTQTLTEQSRSDTAAAVAQVNQDRDALRLVVGADIPAELEPNGELAAIAIRRDLPAGLPSDVLTRRPDVLSAEHTLQADNADIGAARAQFFPRITLTAQDGSESTALGRLFTPGSQAWTFAPQITLPIFAGGANIANLRGAKASRNIALAQYEKAVQTAFRDVADALAVRATIQDRVSAQERLVEAATVSEKLSRARRERGLDSFLTLMDAERTLYSAQQTLIGVKLAELNNRITLYKALGGGG